MTRRLVSPAKPSVIHCSSVVADLDPDLPFLERQHDQQAVVLALVADAAAVILEQLVGVLADVAVPRDGRHRGDDDDVAAGRLEGAAQRIDGARSRDR